MPDFLKQNERSALMKRIKKTGTKPELLLLNALRSRRVRPESNPDDIPGKPDIVFRRDKIACFVDGDLWHGGQWLRRGQQHLAQQFPDSSKRQYWVKKIQRNIQRDMQVTAKLLESGWNVVRFWGSDIERDPAQCADRILRMRTGDEKSSPLSFVASGKSADFFAGIGLMRLGLKGAGWKTVWANDCAPMKGRLYLHNLGGERVELDPRPIGQVGIARVPKVGLIAACFPCTDLSLAGDRKGLEAGEQSSAYLRFSTMIYRLRQRRPAFVILENVLGLIHSHNGKDFRICLERLAAAGYRIDAVKIDAKHFVPQSRPRLFLIGVRNDIDLPLPVLDAATLIPNELRPERLIASIQDNADLSWSIRPMPDLPECTDKVKDILEELDTSHAAWWSNERVKRLQNQVSDRHLRMLSAQIKEHGVVWVTAFRRMRHGKSMAELRFDGIAGCLRTPKGGSAKQILIRADRNGWRVRLLSPRECARLMGANDYKLNAEGVSNDDVLFGFGDAVCVPAVTWLANNYVNPIMNEIIHGKLLATES